MAATAGFEASRSSRAGELRRLTRPAAQPMPPDPARPRVLSILREEPRRSPEHVLEMSECTLMTARAGAVAARMAPSPPATSSAEPQAVLISTLGSAGPSRVPAGSSSNSLMAVPPARLPIASDAMVVALMVPHALVSKTLLAPLTALRETPLLRASRSLLLNLAADQATRRDGTGMRGIEEILISIVRGILKENPHVVAPDSPAASLEVRLAALIEARHTDPNLDVLQLARELHTSRRQLYRHVPAAGGVAEMLTLRRIRTAKLLLQNHPELTIAEVAQRSGFSTTSRLRAQFVSNVGQTPSLYRQRVAGGELAG